MRERIWGTRRRGPGPLTKYLSIRYKRLPSSSTSRNKAAKLFSDNTPPLYPFRVLPASPRFTALQLGLTLLCAYICTLRVRVALSLLSGAQREGERESTLTNEWNLSPASLKSLYFRPLRRVADVAFLRLLFYIPAGFMPLEGISKCRTSSRIKWADWAHSFSWPFSFLKKELARVDRLVEVLAPAHKLDRSAASAGGYIEIPLMRRE